MIQETVKRSILDWEKIFLGDLMKDLRSETLWDSYKFIVKAK